MRTLRIFKLLNPEALPGGRVEAPFLFPATERPAGAILTFTVDGSDDVVRVRVLGCLVDDDVHGSVEAAEVIVEGAQ
ncbi:hypothetical protein [Streptomyces sp. NPDC001068]|uniref:hypothetical protein n=1 Tax=Streptomyces sp. NPDC001068 TaxID=3364544 RepID=UPI003681C744